MWDIYTSEEIIYQFPGTAAESLCRTSQWLMGMLWKSWGCQQPRLLGYKTCSANLLQPCSKQFCSLRQGLGESFTTPLHISGGQIRPVLSPNVQNSLFPNCRGSKGRQNQTEMFQRHGHSAMAIVSERRTQRELSRGYSGAGARLCPVCHDFLGDVLGMPFGTLGSPDSSFHSS